MAKWEELPIADRAQYMKLAVQNGYRDIRTIREAYNEYAKGGHKENKEDKEYNQWLNSEANTNSKLWNTSFEEALNQMKNSRDYNYRVYYDAMKANPNNPEYQRDEKGNYHYNDIGKSVYHPTASKGSIYSGKVDPTYNPTGAVFGDWLDHEYRLSDDMLRAGANPYVTADYLSDAENNGVNLRDENGYMFRDWRYPEETYIGGVLPEVEVLAKPITYNKYPGGGQMNKGFYNHWFNQMKQTPDVFHKNDKRKKVVYKSASGKVFQTSVAAREDSINFKNHRGPYAQSTYTTATVKAGDNLWNIAKANNIDLDTLYAYNPQYRENSMIHPGDKIIVGEKSGNPTTSLYDIRAQWREDAYNNLSNVRAIQSVPHSGNYVIVDKQNQTLNVYDKNNKLLYQTHNISTGASGNDYNTITYVDKQGNIKDKQGNNSTPAGITQITGTGTYHGYPSFTRGRQGKNGKYEDIASSFHYGSTKDKKASNGCVRIAGEDLKQLSKYLSKGTNVYTLPEKGGSRFTVHDGKLNFTADNPYGIDTGDKRFWDDYNVTIDKSYTPLVIKSRTKGDYNYKKNESDYINTITSRKQDLMQRFNLSSDTYNHLAEIAVAMAEQESKFGTANRQKVKDVLHDFGTKVASSARDLIKGRGLNWNDKLSRGYTQVKISADGPEMQKIYSDLGISDSGNWNSTFTPASPDGVSEVAENSALATMAKLAFIYNNEVKGRTFRGAEGEISPYDALIYKWIGENWMLTNHRAVPDNNDYIQNIRRYADNYDMYSER